MKRVSFTKEEMELLMDLKNQPGSMNSKFKSLSEKLGRSRESLSQKYYKTLTKKNKNPIVKNKKEDIVIHKKEITISTPIEINGVTYKVPNNQIIYNGAKISW